MTRDQVANIDTDNRYPFGVAHDFGMLWKQRGFLTSSDQPIKTEKQVAELLHSIQLPRQLAIIKILGHSKSDTLEATGNQLADAAAKQAALKACPTQPRECVLLPINSANPVKDFLLQAQEVATEEEKQIWQSKGGILDSPHRCGLGPIGNP